MTRSSEFGSLNDVGLRAKQERSAPTNESPAPVTLTTFGTLSGGKCRRTTISPDCPCTTTHLPPLLSLIQGAIGVSLPDRRMITKTPRDPHFTTRCWKNGRRWIPIWANPSETRKDKVPLDESESDTLHLERRSRSFRNSDPREKSCIVVHQLPCDMRLSGSSREALYICANSRRFGEENAMGDLSVFAVSSTLHIDGRTAVDLMTEVGSLYTNQLKCKM